MRVARNIMTPLEILYAIESLSESDMETLAILADEKLSEELMKRRQEAFIEMRKGKLLSADDLFKDI
ncbi:MAG: hypothetical protein BWK80_02510 [Desulfobacteraceae bacterium IS3]|jgi:predicted acyltransferase (DUF342 family)|nr:MAG: hypothetical protein BWK80_02510 [Desulfobacteraceae bacterium IS3]HAO19580.1 hypothetical protein [Desulfobacteraceae bacterium]